MRLLRNLEELTPRDVQGAVAIGNFDGVHLGHAQIAARLRERSRAVGGPAVVFTFDPHPVRLLRPGVAPPPLTWTDRKAELLGRLGIDAMIVYPTDEALLKLTAREFFDRIILERLQAKALVEGPNFFFGRERQGTIQVLDEFCRSSGLGLDIVPPLQAEGEIVSSSRVRKLLAAGEIAAANRLLTEPYRIRGMVIHGAARGAKLGFPTANVDAIDTLLPPPGVYAGRAVVTANHTMENARSSYAAAIHIGPNPTFGEHALKVEVHLIGYSGSLYGQPLEVDFIRRLRDIARFPDVESLKQQLQQDVALAAAESLPTTAADTATSNRPR